MSNQVITLGGGCFWCLESALNSVEGVVSAFSGYSNGHVDAPSYEAVCSGNTGHTEVVQVTFDTNILSLRQVLEIFFALHDPTQLNRQGNDVGTQYRSGIYHQDYFSNNPQNQYCNMVVAPKLAKFKKTFASKLKS
jgi:peptide-methionine (S)-S-oxide reductase